MSTLKLENIKHESSSTNNMVMNSDGSISATSVGKIGKDGNDFYITGSASNIAGVYLANSKAMPMKSGVVADGQSDLGSGSYRWKDLYLSGGAYLGGTTSDNHLDDYEEGSWTPVLQSGSTTRAITNAVGRYTKIGREVTVVGSFTRNTATSDAGHLRISGLPFSRFTATYLVPLGSGWMWVDNGTGNDILSHIYMSDAQSVLGVVDHDVRGGRYVPYNDIVNGRPVYFRIDYTAV